MIQTFFCSNLFVYKESLYISLCLFCATNTVLQGQKLSNKYVFFEIKGYVSSPLIVGDFLHLCMHPSSRWQLWAWSGAELWLLSFWP